MAIHEELIRQFDRGLEQVKAEIMAYPSEGALWIINGDIQNSAGNLCFHLVGNLNHFIGAGIGKTGYMRDRPREFQIRDVPRDALLKYIEQTQSMIAQVLSQLPDLNQPYDKFYRKANRTIQEELFHLLGHLQYHLGQINYHRRLLTSK
ncbi:MAG: DinB family protein [Saprospiraceae bacterium]|nr:DinB family protein [Saprospiraceae bacterium]